MKQLKCWLISTVFLVGLFGGSGAIALDLLNLSAYAKGSPVPYGKNVTVMEDPTTGQKWLSYQPRATETGLLTFSDLNVSGDIEIVVDVSNISEFELVLTSSNGDLISLVGTTRFQYPSVVTFWNLNDNLIEISATKVKLSISEQTVKLYDEAKDERLAKITLAKPFLTCTDIEVKGIDSSRDELYELTINTDIQFDKGKQAGIQQCVANPASCGITSGGGSVIKLMNLSTRATIQGGANDVIAGFIISGTGSQKVVIRGSGLEAGVNPMLTVQKFPSGEAVASNNDWQVQTAPSSAIPAQFATEPTNAALLLTLPAGAYTAIMSSVGAKGLGLIEVNAID
ncbi:MAG TPA: hypothetical protein DCM38_12090 [Gammaproteobacteria bacterium]|nr:hypothetical protein [Gammaproteobacteria bacterium]